MTAIKWIAVYLLLMAVATCQTWVRNPPNGSQIGNPPTWPIQRGYNRLVYDPVQQQTLFMAAQNSCNVYTNALWEYNLSTNTFVMKTWSGSFPNPQVCSTPLKPDTSTYPGDRHPFITEVFDSTRGRFVIYGGSEAALNCSGTGPGVCGFQDMYHWFSTSIAAPPGQGWAADCSPCAPKVRMEGEMTYDNVDDLIVMYGGLSNGGSILGDTWTYSGTTNIWTKIQTTCSGSGCQTNACGIGCNSFGQRAGSSMVYDSINEKVVLFGGYIEGHGIDIPQGDTWEYDPVAHSWINYSPTTAPPALKYPALAFDSKRGLVWLHTGLGDPTGDDWTYNVATHNWTHEPITGGPKPTGNMDQNSMIMDYDASNDALVATAHDGTWVPKMWYLSLRSLQH